MDPGSKVGSGLLLAHAASRSREGVDRRCISLLRGARRTPTDRATSWFASPITLPTKPFHGLTPLGPCRCGSCFAVVPILQLTPVAGSNLLSEKVSDSPNFFLDFPRIRITSSNVKVNPVFLWSGHKLVTQLISEDFSFKILGILLIHLNLVGFPFHTSFSKRAAQIFVRNIELLKIAVWDLWIHSTAPWMNTVKRKLERRIPKKSSENRRLFPARGANCNNGFSFENRVFVENW